VKIFIIKVNREIFYFLRFCLKEKEMCVRVLNGIYA